MKVYKFGGASVSSAERIKNVADIIENEAGNELLIVISAMGKTTNALEKVAEEFFEGNNNNALALFEIIKNDHIGILQNIVTINKAIAIDHLKDFFTEIEWLLHDKPVQEFDYYYDQIVCIGELLSTAIISDYFKERNILNNWIDVRDIIRTDDNFRDGNVDIIYTSKMCTEALIPLFKNSPIIITQGYIGSTDENESTTLGREGSDYTAALLANICNAESLTIWKDVKGIMNADPKQFQEAILIKDLGFKEVIEMAYYGAQVIHPKTIKPLQNKNIPLYVKCFLDTSLPGTLISNTISHNLPPIFVLKEKQVLLNLSTKDFSFIGESSVSDLYEIFAELKLKPNLTQNGAINFMVCLDDLPEKIEKLALKASDFFDVHLERDLTLLSIRHYTEEKLQELKEGRKIVLEQRTPNTVLVLMRSNN